MGMIARTAFEAAVGRTLSGKQCEERKEYCRELIHSEAVVEEDLLRVAGSQ